MMSFRLSLLANCNLDVRYGAGNADSIIVVITSNTKPHRELGQWHVFCGLICNVLILFVRCSLEGGPFHWFTSQTTQSHTSSFSSTCQKATSNDGDFSYAPLPMTVAKGPHSNSIHYLYRKVHPLLTSSHHSKAKVTYGISLGLILVEKMEAMWYMN